MKLLKIISYLILDYAVILRLSYWNKFKNQIPIGFSKGLQGNVVLVTGWSEKWSSLKVIANELNRDGYKIHVVPGLESNHEKIHIGVEILENFIKTKDLKNVNLVCHSKGGLIGKLFIDTSRFSNRVSKVITIATP